MISYANKRREQVNWLKAMYFDHPWWTPGVVNFLPAVWIKYRADLEEVVLAHPKVFPGYVQGARDFDEVTDPFQKVGDVTTSWGCGWHNDTLGMVGQAVRHPLEDWAALEHWTPPDPLRDDLLGPRDWKRVAEDLAKAKREGHVAGGGGLPHNMVFLLLTDLRGFENLMLDLATDEPNLHQLLGIIQRHNVAVIQKYLELGVEMMFFGEDQGLQTSLPMSPAMWRQFFKPVFEAMYGPCRDRGVPVFMHTDGHILEIIPDLIETGVRVLNPQFRSNGLAGLVEVARGKVALSQDLDRQLLPFVTPAGVAEHIGQVHEALVTDKGGLMLVAEVTPDFPLANIDAICTALEKVCRLPEPADR